MEQNLLQEPRPERSFNQDADVEDNEENVGDRQVSDSLKPDENAQNWLLRHLKSYLENVPEPILNEFIMQQDITIFRNFITDTQRRQCLFIIIEREQPLERPQNKFFDPNPVMIPVEEPEQNESKEQVVEPNQEHMEKELERELQADKPLIKIEKKARKMRPSKRSKKDKQKPKKSRSKSKAKEKGEEKADKKDKKAKKDEKEVKKEEQTQQNQQPESALPVLDPFAVDLTAQPKIEVTLRWQNGRQIPVESTEFIFLATRDEPNSGVKSEMLLKEKLDFERRIDILLQMELTDGHAKWQDGENRFENFIADSLVYAYSGPKRSQLDAMIDALADNEVMDLESVEALLRSRVRAFTKTPTKQAAIQVKLELSLYEIKFLIGEMYSERVVERLRRIVTLFSVIFMLYHSTNGEWIQKALFHCVELTSRIIATNMHQRIWNLVYDDCEGERSTTTIGDERHAAIMHDLKPILLELIDLCIKAIPESNDEHSCLEKIGQCVKIIDFIEEEFKKFQRLVLDMRDENRDMSFDRSRLESAKQISYFESALESGNYDAIKNVCLQLTYLNAQLADALPKLDEYCGKQHNV